MASVGGGADMSKDKTTVVFRVWRKYPHTVLALFPGLQVGYDRTSIRECCQSYEHIGQHGAANYVFCITRTKPATPAEYADLAAELRERGYELNIRARRTRVASF